MDSAEALIQWSDFGIPKILQRRFEKNVFTVLSFI
jgi:hypothetical protein